MSGVDETSKALATLNAVLYEREDIDLKYQHVSCHWMHWRKSCSQKLTRQQTT